MSWSRLGLRVRPRDPGGDAATYVEQLVTVAVGAQSAGFDAIWLAAAGAAAGPESVRTAGGLDPFVTAAALAPLTTSIRLGCLDLRPGDRAPAMLAKAVTSLDVLSGGRAAAGVDARGEAGATVEVLEIVRAMLTVDAPSYAGTRHHIREAWNEPRRRDAHPPLVVRFTPAPAAADGELHAAVARLADGCVVRGGAGAVEQAAASLSAPDGSFAVLALVAAEGDVVAAARSCLAAGAAGVVVDLPVDAAAAHRVEQLADELAPLMS